MPYPRSHAIVVISALAVPAIMTIAPAHAAPSLPSFCVPATVVDDVCTARLASLTTDVVNGTITGAPVGSTETVTLAGQGDAYLKSTGFGSAAPDAVRDWDATLERVNSLSVDPDDPNWYGNAKSKVFLSRTLNELATQFPPGSLEVEFAPDDTQPGTFRLVSIQPIFP